MSLVPLPPVRRHHLVAFDIRHGLPCALRVLRAALGCGGLVRTIGDLVWRSRRDPLASLPLRWPADQEWLVRRQLRPVVLLDDVLRLDRKLDKPRRLALLRRVVSETGARFVATNVPTKAADAWRRGSQQERNQFAASLVRRFFNVDATTPVADDRSLSFDVTRCRFAELTAELGRPYLGPMFCEADAVFFARPDVSLSLHRTSTIAEGAACCDFHFRYPETEETP